MLTLLVGTPGSGKTLFAIDKVIKIANNEDVELKKIQYVYTNISGFNFDKFKDNKVKFDKLVFDSFYVHLKVLFSLFVQNENKDDLDTILQDYCKEHNILNAYFIIDEAHNYFDNQDKVKNWWFTYHRHLNHEILLITQNKSLINAQYRNIPEIFIKAQPRSKAMSKNILRYFNYTEYRMTQKYSTTEITINDTYFDLYTSGNKSSQKLVGLKYIFMFALFILFFITLFSMFIYRMYFTNPTQAKEQQKTQPADTINKTVQTSQIPQNQQTNPNQIITTQPAGIQNENLKLFKFNCFDTLCYFQFDDKSTFEIPQNILKVYLMDIENDKKFFELKNNRLAIYVLVPETKFNFIKQGVQNDNKIETGAFNLLTNTK